MRKLYWKIFLAFWVTSIAVIFTTVYITLHWRSLGTHWSQLGLHLLFTILTSGFLCYVLSIYLTNPLKRIIQATQQIGTGKFTTRIGEIGGHQHDELATLGHEFDVMAKQLESLHQTNHRLLQDISHELRSPIARLLIAIEIGRNKTKKLADAEFDRMEAESLRLEALISEILDAARVDNPEAEPVKETIDFNKLIEQIIGDANFEFAKNKPRVIAEIHNKITLLHNETLLRRAIENVLRNAIRYSPKNKPVTIQVDENPKKNTVTVTIRDHGPGVPSNQLTKIFDPFYRVDTSREKKTGGYGLGLAIAKQAIEQHNGTIKAKNHPDGGLVIEIVLHQ